MTVLDGVYVDAPEARGVLSMRPKVALEAVLGNPIRKRVASLAAASGFRRLGHIRQELERSHDSRLTIPMGEWDVLSHQIAVDLI